MATDVQINGQLLSVFNAKMQSYPTFIRGRSVEIFQGRQRSTMLLLSNQIEALTMRCKIDFFGTNAERTAYQSSFEAMFQAHAPVELIIGDGFRYQAVLISSSDGLTEHEFVTTVQYQMRVTRHLAPVSQSISWWHGAVTCKSNVDRTDCKITISSGHSGGETVILTLNGYSWTIYGNDNPNDEEIVIDGINKVFTIGGRNAAGIIQWTDFPYLIPGENTITTQIAGIIVDGLPATIEYVPTFV
ncbi:MAG: hypothetical protein IKO68_00075 [Oscillospiraceae bacterium]|nr:hypothetical protein [Oscillospiraceae bacterium]MBR4654991.1 hypothetical protein [Oscillospiraceae bacterium]